MSYLFIFYCLTCLFIKSIKSTLIWHAPFFSGGGKLLHNINIILTIIITFMFDFFLLIKGYCSEATSFILGLYNHTNYDIAIRHHGDSYSNTYVKNLRLNVKNILFKLQYKQISKKQKTISICHSERK